MSFLNFAGDARADLRHHGSRDKAVCVHCYEHYPFWEKGLGRNLECGAFGENLTIHGAVEKDIRIGDFSAWRNRCPGRPAAAAVL